MPTAITQRAGIARSSATSLDFTAPSIRDRQRFANLLCSERCLAGRERRATRQTVRCISDRFAAIAFRFARVAGMMATLAREVCMSTRQMTCAGVMVAAAVAVLSRALAAQNAATPGATGGATPAQAMPQYDKDGALQLPSDYRQWIFIGSSLGLSYSQVGPLSMTMEMFHETLMEPTAYKHFVDTGTFREGTMLALLLHGIGQNVMPARQGKFATDVHGVEMAVKDASHRPEGWAYYNFGGMAGIRKSAQAMPKESCYNCHVQHAKRDNVFLQFYGLLAEAA